MSRFYLHFNPVSFDITLICILAKFYHQRRYLVGAKKITQNVHQFLLAVITKQFEAEQGDEQ